MLTNFIVRHNPQEPLLMRSCKVNTAQVLGVVGGCTERVNKGSVREWVLCVALHIHCAVCDDAVPLLACGCADGTFIREP